MRPHDLHPAGAAPGGGEKDPATERSGPAFPISIKGIATLLVGALIVYGASVQQHLRTAEWSLPALAFMVATAGVIALCYYWILFSTTSIDHAAIRQTWIWNKEVALEDIRDVKFIYIPYFAWLIAPRLVVRVRGGALYTFHAADRSVLQQFAVLRFGHVFTQ